MNTKALKVIIWTALTVIGGAAVVVVAGMLLLAMLAFSAD
ncbi:hypothetical protein STSP_25450 [Streptomyces jeddahensis]|uniref:Uncharacterized protein n=1 Tax=Streptomyces jeddahensis TaxID=1716141 RepID=A0A177HTR6_9ACTN|nr:hypothetical protein STSP_25450 [Streptomyces jeddahensis]